MVSLMAKMMLGMRKKVQHPRLNQKAFCEERTRGSPLSCTGRGSPRAPEGFGEPCGGSSRWLWGCGGPGCPKFVLVGGRMLYHVSPCWTLTAGRGQGQDPYVPRGQRCGRTVSPARCPGPWRAAGTKPRPPSTGTGSRGINAAPACGGGMCFAALCAASTGASRSQQPPPAAEVSTYRLADPVEVLREVAQLLPREAADLLGRGKAAWRAAARPTAQLQPRSPLTSGSQTRAGGFRCPFPSCRSPFSLSLPGHGVFCSPKGRSSPAHLPEDLLGLHRQPGFHGGRGGQRRPHPLLGKHSEDDVGAGDAAPGMSEQGVQHRAHAELHTGSDCWGTGKRDPPRGETLARGDSPGDGSAGDAGTPWCCRGTCVCSRAKGDRAAPGGVFPGSPITLSPVFGVGLQEPVRVPGDAAPSGRGPGRFPPASPAGQ